MTSRCESLPTDITCILWIHLLLSSVCISYSIHTFWQVLGAAHSCMCQYMILQKASAWECLFTYITFIWLLTSVSLHMTPQITSHCESLPTDSTFTVWIHLLLSSVCISYCIHTFWQVFGAVHRRYLSNLLNPTRCLAIRCSPNFCCQTGLTAVRLDSSTWGSKRVNIVNTVDVKFAFIVLINCAMTILMNE